MENKTYVITLATGSYDSYNVRTLFVTNDFEKGQSYVNKKNLAYKSLSEKLTSFYANEYKQWIRDNPRPPLGDYDLIPIPKWASGVKVTKEMRQEREAINLINKERAKKSMEGMTLWLNEHKNFINFEAKNTVL